MTRAQLIARQRLWHRLWKALGDDLSPLEAFVKSLELKKRRRDGAIRGSAPVARKKRRSVVVDDQLPRFDITVARYRRWIKELRDLVLGHEAMLAEGHESPEKLERIEELAARCRAIADALETWCETGVETGIMLKLSKEFDRLEEKRGGT